MTAPEFFQRRAQLLDYLLFESQYDFPHHHVRSAVTDKTLNQRSGGPRTSIYDLRSTRLVGSRPESDMKLRLRYKRDRDNPQEERE